MSLRYRKSGLLYIPQYLTKDNTWSDFKVKDIVAELANLCYALASINTNRYASKQWYFEPTKRENKQEMIIFFREEMYASAFLGAAKIYYDQTIKEFSL